MRTILLPLRDLAERQDVAIVAVMHLNKSTGNTSAIHRVVGSVAFAAACRMMWLVTKDPDNERRRLLLPVKSNLNNQGDGISFSIMEHGKLAWYIPEQAVTCPHCNMYSSEYLLTPRADRTVSTNSMGVRASRT